MSILESVTTGKRVGAQIHTIFGQNGVGKTTFAASFPKPIVLDLEDGSKHIDVARLGSDKLTDFAKVRGALAELINSKHDFQTVVIDSAESLEALIFDAVCAEGKVTSIEEYGGGYGKGYTRGREILRDVMNDLKVLQSKGITTIIVAHTQTKTHTDPTSNQSYDRIIMRMNDKMAAVVRDLSDNVLFATYKVFTTQDKNKKTQAFGDGQRILLTQWRPGYDAKNRLELPPELPLSYEAFVEAANKDVKVDDLVSDIRAMAEKVDASLKTTVEEQLEKFKGDLAKLKQVKNRLMKYVA